MGTEGWFLGAKKLGFETGYPLPSNAEFKNDGAIPPCPFTFMT
jgi:hypothetical protein